MPQGTGRPFEHFAYVRTAGQAAVRRRAAAAARGACAG